MATAAHLRKLALALPEVEEKSHFAQPDFRVRGKIFAGLSRDEARGTLKLTAEIQSTVVDAGDEAATGTGAAGDAIGVFTPCPGAWGRSGWTFVDLERVTVDVLRELLTEAWRLVAPKKLIASFDDDAATPKTKTAKAKKKPKKKTAKATPKKIHV